MFLEESSKPPRQSDETFGRRLGLINMAYKLSVLEQISLLSIFILLLTCLLIATTNTARLKKHTDKSETVSQILSIMVMGADLWIALGGQQNI